MLIAPRLSAGPVGDDPFEALYAVPQGVDAAAVFNDPARTLLLSDSGRSVRLLLAGAGVFTHTEHAWEALAQALGDDTDGTITALLGGRVVVVWDGIGAGSVTGLADAIDTRWALMCEVDQSYLKRIRNRLKPVKRDILQGRPLYAIEKGRYGIVLLDSPDDDHPASVLLAPSTGTKLLSQILASTLRARRDAQEDVHERSVMRDRARLVAQLPPRHDDGGSSSWAVAWLVQTDRLWRNGDARPAHDNGDPRAASRPGRALAGLMSIDSGGVRLSFASDLSPDPALDDAPAGLLDAIGDNAVLALATARFPSMLTEGHTMNTMSLRFPRSDPLDPDDPSGPEDAGPDHGGFFASPGLVVLSPIGPGVAQHSGGSITDPDATNLALSVLMRRPTRPGDDPFAARADRAMHELLRGHDPAQAPDYGGAFPGAVRTQTISMAPIASSTPEPPSAGAAPGADTTPPWGSPSSTNRAWPGAQSSLSWVSADLHHMGVMAVSLAPSGCDTSGRVRALSRAATTLAAIDDRPMESGVLLRGYVRPAMLFELLGDAWSMELTISKFIDKVSFDITRTPGGGVRGEMGIELTARTGRAKLGNRGD